MKMKLQSIIQKKKERSRSMNCFQDEDKNLFLMQKVKKMINDQVNRGKNA